MQPRQSQKRPVNRRNGAVLDQIIGKIQESDSILIALSKNPSVDELATAVGLAMFIDGMDKHATAIYSGETPNVLAFLNPEQQLENNTNGLQDFIIAINKDKADHLRYKLDGDYVKVYITPYRTTITENDLEFSHGDYNVDLVISLNVEDAGRLDSALSEYGRIMHDATIINVAVGTNGGFGEIQWTNPEASSVAEMVGELLLAMEGNVKVEGEVATAILTGIVAATERFSNERTRPETMAMASKLMMLGADQQLISANIIKEEEPKGFEMDEGEMATTQGGAEGSGVPEGDDVMGEGVGSVPAGVPEGGVSVGVASEGGAPMKEKDDTVLDVQAEAKAQEAQKMMEGAQGATGEVRDIAGGVQGATEGQVNLERVQNVSAEPQNAPAGQGQMPRNAQVANEPMGAVEVAHSPLDTIVRPEEEVSGVAVNAGGVNIEPVNAEPVATALAMPAGTVPATVAPEVELTPNAEPVANAGPEPMAGPMPNAEPASQFSIPTLNANVMAEINGQKEEDKAEEPEKPPLDEREAEIAALPGISGSGKDYGSMIEEALAEPDNKKDAGVSGYIGSNPALAAAPEVNEGLDANGLPKMSFDQPVNMSDEADRAGGEESYLAGSPMKDLKSGTDSASASVTGAGVSASAGGVPDMGNAQPAMSAGGGVPDNILPPPPAPPIDFNAGMLPQVDENLVNGVAPAMDTQSNVQNANAMQAEPAVEKPLPDLNNLTNQGDTGVKSDPGAFRIPGM